MIDTKELWRKRFIQYFKEVSRYLRYMLNDHLMIALLFLLGGGAYLYNTWLKEIPEDFPYALIIALILAVMLTNSRIQTLLKDPDLVFLLPVEKKLPPYFQKAFWLSFLLQGYWLLLLYAVIVPLYIAATGHSVLSAISLFGFVLLAKVWNLLMTWNVQYFTETSTRYSDILVRFVMNFVLIYLLFSSASFFFIGSIIVLMVLLILYFQKTASSKTLKWDYLIDLESKRMMTFYRLANLFTDVPKLKERVKKRAWLNWLTSFISYTKKNSFAYLYTRTFLRTSDYLGMFVRLTIIGGLILYFSPFVYGNIAVTILFLYLTGYQLITLWRHHSLKIWIHLYPIQIETRLKSFLLLLQSILLVQLALFSLLLVFKHIVIISGAVFLSGVVFILVFVNLYVKEKIKKVEKTF